jgi:FkbM family methyltransferase
MFNITTWAAKFRKASRIAYTIENWYEVYTHIMRNKPLTELKLKDGNIIFAPDDLQLWNHYNDIWEHKSYTSKIGISKDSIVIDIGANIGLFSLLAAKNAARVYSFEPMSENFFYLQRNVAANRLSNVSYFNYAVAAHSGQIKIAKNDALTACSIYSELADSYENVNCTTLVEIFNQNGLEKCDFLKIDCEGSEFEILFSTPTNILSKIGTISMEFHDHLTEYTHKDLIPYLVENGYSVEVTKIAGSCGIMVCTKR